MSQTTWAQNWSRSFSRWKLNYNQSRKGAWKIWKRSSFKTREVL